MTDSSRISVFDLERLIDPIQPQRFFEDYWEKRPLHLQRRPRSYYDLILSGKDLENIIASPNTRYPAIRLTRNGAYYPPEAYTHDIKYGDDSFSGVLDVGKIQAEYRSGATICLPALHRTWTRLTDLCVKLEDQLDHAVHANAYLTPGNTAGFTPHYDTHEVMVLQIAGRKRWRIYEPPVVLPHRRQPFNPGTYVLPAAPLLEIDLEQGDLLYLPRGYVHTTTTSDSYSAHVTIGITVYTWLDLAGELLQSAIGSSRFRQSLPVGFASRENIRPALKKELASVLDELRQQHGDCEQLVSAFSDRIRSARTKTEDIFHADVVLIGPDTLLAGPHVSEYRRTEEGSGKITLEFQGRKFKLPAEARMALDAISMKSAFRVKELPGPLDLEAKLILVRYLQERKFLKCV